MPASNFSSAKGTLYLLPTGLGDAGSFVMPGGYFTEVVSSLTSYIVEEVRTARRFISSLHLGLVIDKLSFEVLNEHSKSEDLHSLIAPLLRGVDVGLMSEAGYPAIADPGSQVVQLAHQHGIKVVPLPGYSSLFLALAASGLNGQRFSFCGYLPVKSPDREKEIRRIERRSGEEKQTQIFIEAPYRNQKLLESLLATCLPATKLCIAADITLTSECIRTYTIAGWRSQQPDINKRPVVFVLQA